MKKLIIIIAAIVITSCGGSGTTKKAEEPKQDPIEILALNLKQDGVSTTVYATIHNNTSKVASYVDMQSFFLAADSITVIGSGLGNCTNLQPGESKTIEILCADDVSGAAQYKVEMGNVVW